MKISLAEFSVILDTLDKSLMIGGMQLFSYDREAREKVRDHLMVLANRIFLELAEEMEEDEPN